MPAVVNTSRNSASDERVEKIKLNRPVWLNNLPKDFHSLQSFAVYDAGKKPRNVKWLPDITDYSLIGNSDIANLVTLADAIAALDKHPDLILGPAVALRVAFGIAAIDLDCPNKKFRELLETPPKNMLPADWEAELVVRRARQIEVNNLIHKIFNDAGALVMLSQSGNGIHIFFRYSLPKEGMILPNGKFGLCGQLIAHSGYVYVTGEQIGKTRFGAEDSLPDLTHIYMEAFGALKASGDFKQTRSATGTDETGAKFEVGPSTDYGRRLDLTDDDVVAKTKVRDKSEHDCHAILTDGKLVNTPKGTPSASMAITHAVSVLDRISGNPAQIERIIMASAVVRLSPPPERSKETRAHKTHRLLPGILRAKRAGYDDHRARKEQESLALAQAVDLSEWEKRPLPPEAPAPRVPLSALEPGCNAALEAPLAAIANNPGLALDGPAEDPVQAGHTPVSFDSVVADIAAFTVQVAGTKERVYPDALEEIVFKIALLSADRRLSPAKVQTLQRMLLSTGVHGFSDAGNGRGISDIRRMVDDACLKIMNERRTESWQGNLMRGERGSVLANEENAVIAVENMFGEKLFYDRFTDEIVLAGKRMTTLDHMDALIAVQRVAVSGTKPTQIRAAITHVARKNEGDSLQRYLRDLQWDGVSRLNEWLVWLLGAPNTRYNQTIGRWFVIGACARALRPGCQMDNMLVLAGGQGIGKTSAMRIMSGGRNIEFAADFTTKDGQQAMRGKWFVEMSELSSLNKSDQNAYKAFQTRIEDEYRKAYDIETVKYPRQFVTVGTTNDMPFFRDATGERRYWVIPASAVNKAGLAAHIDQIWAEAVVCLDADEKWWPETGSDQWFFDEQEQVNSAWALVDQWQPIIEDYLITAGANGLPAMKVRGASWLLEGILKRERGHINQSDANRVAAIMTKLGYKNQTVWIESKAGQGYAWKGDASKKGWWNRELDGL